MRTAAPRIFAVLLLGVGLVAPVRAHDPFSGAQPKQRAPAAETQPRKGRQAPAKKKASRPPPAADGAREDDEREGRPTDQDAPLTPPAPPDERETAAA
jgi:hypothetical protein